MDSLHEGAAPARPAPPAGLVRGALAYAEDLEPRREEWFLAGTETALVTPVAAAAVRPRILAPADGAILAMDPDIPARRQRVAIRVSGAQAGARLQVDGAAAMPAEAIGLWLPTPGRHRLRLVAADGGELDRVRVTVRGLR
jgi:penicillin-binding protein 1C